jgi:hypothetical protein
VVASTHCTMCGKDLPLITSPRPRTVREPMALGTSFFNGELGMHVMQELTKLNFALALPRRSMQSPCMFMVHRIQGTTGVELVSGLHWYLKYWCGAHISWDKTGGAQLASVPLPGSLPRVKGEGVKIERPVPWNYYQNVVTSSCESFLCFSGFCFHSPFFVFKSYSYLQHQALKSLITVGTLLSWCLESTYA